MSSEKDKQRMIPTADFAAMVGRDPHTMALWRAEKYGPQPIRKIGNTLFYDEAECVKWAEAFNLVQRKPSGGA